MAKPKTGRKTTTAAVALTEHQIAALRAIARHVQIPPAELIGFAVQQLFGKTLEDVSQKLIDAKLLEPGDTHIPIDTEYIREILESMDYLPIRG